MSYLVVTDVSKRFAEMDRPAVDEISLSLGEREILALVGESGSGKTTISRIIAGFEVGDSGSIALAGETLWDRRRYVPPEQRRIGYVFQENTLFPHMTVAANIAFGLETLDPEAKREAHIRRLLAMAGLEGLEHRYPHEISGGQAQRVALVRALAPKPRLLILDEPFNNLDVSLKTRVVRETGEILRESGIPAILVTHRPEEAFAVADRMTVIRGGHVVQKGTPDDLYHYPVDRTVAEFFGPINELAAHEAGGRWETSFGTVPDRAIRTTTEGPVAYIRPECFEIVPDSDGTDQDADGSVACRVQRITSFGSHHEIIVKTEAGADPLLVWTRPDSWLPDESPTTAGIRLRFSSPRSVAQTSTAAGKGP